MVSESRGQNSHAAGPAKPSQAKPTQAKPSHAKQDQSSAGKGKPTGPSRTKQIQSCAEMSRHLSLCRIDSFCLCTSGHGAPRYPLAPWSPLPPRGSSTMVYRSDPRAAGSSAGQLRMRSRPCAFTASPTWRPTTALFVRGALLCWAIGSSRMRCDLSSAWCVMLPKNAEPTQEKTRQAKSSQAKPRQPKPSQAKPRQAKQNQLRKGQGKPSQAKPRNRGQPEPSRTSHAKPSQTTPSQVRPYRTAPCQVKPHRTESTSTLVQSGSTPHMQDMFQ